MDGDHRSLWEQCREGVMPNTILFRPWHLALSSVFLHRYTCPLFLQPAPREEHGDDFNADYRQDNQQHGMIRYQTNHYDCKRKQLGDQERITQGIQIAAMCG